MSGARGARVPTGSDGRPVGRDAELVTLLSSYQDTVVRSGLLDSVTTEIVRLRCARSHDCRICQTLRLADAVTSGINDQMLDQIDFYETSTLSERHKVALRIVDAFIWQPADISDDLVAQAHEHFTDAEIAEILVDITKWSTQKIHVSLGTDGADRLTVDAQGISYFSFSADGKAAILTTDR